MCVRADPPQDPPRACRCRADVLREYAFLFFLGGPLTVGGEHVPMSTAPPSGYLSEVLVKKRGKGNRRVDGYLARRLFAASVALPLMLVSTPLTCRVRLVGDHRRDVGWIDAVALYGVGDFCH